MALFFLSYDLRNKRDYQSLYKVLENFQAIRVLESCWCFRCEGTTSKMLRDYFKQFVDGDDCLIVIQCNEINNTPQWAGLNLLGNPNQL
ncbi:MAG: hypothetical protein J6R59_13555 [Paludibacteraceae bacterium]|nr:hypothetical protein [Paludibacteraceae bacterium]MBO5829459.1 hypothetical protein [Paludibacteraceae bacterium]